MKKFFQIICCAVGSGMVGYFANKLDNVVGVILFTIGIFLLIGSITVIMKQEKDDK